MNDLAVSVAWLGLRLVVFIALPSEAQSRRVPKITSFSRRRKKASGREGNFGGGPLAICSCSNVFGQNP